MREPRTQESVRNQDTELYNASETRTLLRRTRGQDPMTTQNPGPYRELCCSIVSTDLVNNYFVGRFLNLLP